MTIRRWGLCLLFGPATVAMAQPVPVPAIIKDINEINDGTGAGGGGTPGGPRRTASSLPNEMVRVGASSVFFAATDDKKGRELWVYSTQTAAPQRFDLLDGGQVPLSSDPRLLTPVGTGAFLAANVTVVVSGSNVLRERVMVANGTSAPTVVTLTGGVPDAYTVQDIAPVGNGVMFALFASNTLSFWRSDAAGTPAQLVLQDNHHRMVGDMLDCAFDGTGFVAFTSMSTNSPGQRLLSALRDPVSPTIDLIYTGDVDNLTADGDAVYFTAEDSGTQRLYRWTIASELEEIQSASGTIEHLMPAGFAGQQRLYFVLGTSGGAREVWYAFNDKVRFVPWPAGTSNVRITASLLVGGIPHLLGTGVKSSGSFWAIWRTNSDGSAMTELKELPGWGGCSHLAVNNAGKLAFFGYYYTGTPDMLSSHLGFVTFVGGLPQVTSDPIPDLTVGSAPSSLLALDTRVVFRASHRLMGIEPWHRDFP